MKTYVLRHLPVLVYKPQTSKAAECNHRDPTISSLYFDNPEFSLYTGKVNRTLPASSLRLRWYGHLTDKPEISFEQKILKDDDISEEIRFSIKEKHINAFMNGEHHMKKNIQKLQARQGDESEEAKILQENVYNIQSFIRDHALQPILRANYTRTAFQVPGDFRVRISIDTNLVLIREDCLDIDRPCRDPEDWHRRDLDEEPMDYPFPRIRKGEIVRFPYALLEIKVKDSANRRISGWVEELMSSHLVKEAPRFSKFVHGVAQLFEDHVNSFPFWLPYLETDIRRDPKDAFREEQEKKAQKAEDEAVVGSFYKNQTASFEPVIGSPIGQSSLILGDVSAWKKGNLESPAGMPNSPVNDGGEGEDFDMDSQFKNQISTPPKGLRSLFPLLWTSKYARAHMKQTLDLPPGVRKPGKLIKDSGPVRVEPKVWLANQVFRYISCYVNGG